MVSMCNSVCGPNVLCLTGSLCIQLLVCLRNASRTTGWQILRYHASGSVSMPRHRPNAEIARQLPTFMLLQCICMDSIMLC